MTRAISALLTRTDRETVRLSVPDVPGRLLVHAAASPFSAPAPEPLLMLETPTEADLHWPVSDGRAGVVVTGAGRTCFIAERHVALEQVINCRDLGGYGSDDGRRVRWGHLFRSADLSDASPNDVLALSRLGVGLVGDFRTTEEARRDPDRLPPGDCAYVNLPLGQSALSPEDSAAIRSGSMDWYEGGGMTRIYLAWIATCAPGWANLMSRIAQAEGRAVLVHCVAGKDRTGVFAALLLALLGVTDDDILADHQLSNGAIARLQAASERHRHRDGDKPETVLPGLPAPADAMRAFLAAIRASHGSAAAYLHERGGLDPDRVALLRERLLE